MSTLVTGKFTGGNIARAIHMQEEIGLGMLVHGACERRARC